MTDNKPHCYIITGLGADFLPFSRLKFPIDYTFLPWIENNENESLQSYAVRMAKGIKHKNPILIGLSFGGIVAQEISKHIPLGKLILISTITHKKELPFHLKLVCVLKLHKFIPNRILLGSNFIANWIFSLVTKQEKEILQRCLKGNKPSHFKWAISHILNYKGNSAFGNTVRIHSMQDRIFPIQKIEANYVVSSGHFAIFSNFTAIQPILDK